MSWSETLSTQLICTSVQLFTWPLGFFTEKHKSETSKQQKIFKKFHLCVSFDLKYICLFCKIYVLSVKAICLVYKVDWPFVNFFSNAHRKGKHTKHTTWYIACPRKPCCENKNKHKSHINCTYTDNMGRTITIGGKWGHGRHQMLGHNSVL